MMNCIILDIFKKYRQSKKLFKGVIPNDRYIYGEEGLK